MAVLADLLPLLEALDVSVDEDGLELRGGGEALELVVRDGREERGLARALLGHDGRQVFRKAEVVLFKESCHRMCANRWKIYLRKYPAKNVFYPT